MVARWLMLAKLLMKSLQLVLRSSVADEDEAPVLQRQAIT